jgi:membrane dipeptidase
MKYIDFHCDTISELADHPEAGTLQRSRLCIDLEKLGKGAAAIQDFALFVDMHRCSDPWERYQFLLQCYKRELERNQDRLHPVLSAADVGLADREGKIGSMLSIEEGGVIGGSADKLDQVWKDGVRLITLTWNYPNELGWPNGMEGPDKGITETGWNIIDRMDELHMIVDTSHLNDQGTREILERRKRAPVASHSDARALTQVPRNLPDDLIRAFGEKGGLIGLNFSRNFIGSKAVDSLPGRMDIDFSAGPVRCTLIHDIVRHARHLTEVGGEDTVCLGTDFDGIEPFLELKDASQMPKLADAMKKGGFTEAQVEKIFRKNAERYLKDTLA